MYFSQRLQKQSSFTHSCNSSPLMLSAVLSSINRCTVVSILTCSQHLIAVRSTSIHEIKKQNINVVNIIRTQPDSKYKKQSPNHSYQLKLMVLQLCRFYHIHNLWSLQFNIPLLNPSIWNIWTSLRRYDYTGLWK